MAKLSWNEIQDRAAGFSGKWSGEMYEKGESQSFWSEFLFVFGIDRVSDTEHLALLFEKYQSA